MQQEYLGLTPGGLRVHSMAKERRRSVLGQSRGPTERRSVFWVTPQTGVSGDPRPLTDRSFQERIGRELFEYMTQNSFEAEMKHVLSRNALKSPTQKDFSSMFQWLYRRIDPHHRFQKGIDQELPLILKQLRYPFEKGITKSGIAAAGGHNWGAFLGILHWMMQLSRMLDGYARGRYDDAYEGSGVDISRDRIVFSFLSDAYGDWLDMDEEASDEDVERVLEPHVSAMAAAFAQSCSRFASELEVLESEDARLRKAIEDMRKTTPGSAVLDSHFKIMEEDKGEFLEYIKQAEQRSERYEDRNRVLEEELEKLHEELKEVEDERCVMLRSLNAQGISMQDIDRMDSERGRLQQRIESASGTLAAGRKHVAKKEAEARRKLGELKRAVEKFNELAYRSALIPATATNAKGQNYGLEVTADDGLGSAMPNPFKAERPPGGSTAGHQPGRILNLDLRGRVRGALLSLRRDISDRRGAAMEDMMQDHELLDGIEEAIEDRHSEIDALQHRVHAAELEYEKTKEVTQAQKMSSDTQIDKMERELSRMRSGLAEAVRVLERREMSATMEYERLVLRASALREELHTNVDRMLNDVVSFKIRVQSSLDDYERFVAGELKHEWS